MKEKFIFSLMLMVYFHMHSEHSQASGNSAQELLFSHGNNAYSAVCIDSTIHLAVYSHEDSAVFHYSLIDGSLRREHVFRNQVLYGFEKETGSPELGGPFIKLNNKLELFFKNFDSFTLINLLDKKEFNFLDFDRKSEFLYPVDIFSNHDDQFLIYSDNNAYKKFVMGVDEIHRRYGKDYLYKIQSDSKPDIIHKGRFNTLGFKATIVNDTLHAIWQMNGKKSFAWIDFISGKPMNRIVTGRFDGDRWSKPAVVVKDEEKKAMINAPVGIFKINGKTYVFWSGSQDSLHQNTEGIWYKFNVDGLRWSEAVRAEGIDKVIDSIQDGNGIVHLVGSREEDPGRNNYYVFNGNTIQEIIPAISENSYEEQIVWRNDKHTVVFWKNRNEKKSRLYYRIVNIEPYAGH